MGISADDLWGFLGQSLRAHSLVYQILGTWKEVEFPEYPSLCMSWFGNRKFSDKEYHYPIPFYWLEVSSYGHPQPDSTVEPTKFRNQQGCNLNCHQANSRNLYPGHPGRRLCQWAAHNFDTSTGRCLMDHGDPMIFWPIKLIHGWDLLKNMAKLQVSETICGLLALLVT